MINDSISVSFSELVLNETVDLGQLHQVEHNIVKDIMRV